ncbi:methionyl-tRNA formyltransferase [Pseudomonas sp. NPDC047961]
MASTSGSWLARTVYVTCTDSGELTLRRMLKAGVPVALVVSLPPELGAKYNVSGYCDPGPLCARYGVKVRYLSSYAFVSSDLNDISFEVLIVNGWNRLIPAEVFCLASMGSLGLHAGHPPIGLGRAPIVWNILLGYRDIELYAFNLTERADDGEIFAVAPIEITRFDTARTLYEKVGHVAFDLFFRAVLKLQNSEQGAPQEHKALRYYKKRTPEDGLIDFSQDVNEIVDFVRAQSRPYPGAFSFIDGQKWIFTKAIPFDQFAYREYLRTPGEILAALPSGLVVSTGSSPLWLVEAENQQGVTVPTSLDEMECFVGRIFLGSSFAKVRDPYEQKHAL